jgi:hypothetical protein
MLTVSARMLGAEIELIKKQSKRLLQEEKKDFLMLTIKTFKKAFGVYCGKYCTCFNLKH